MSEPTVEEALAELKTIFGDSRDYEIRLRNWGAPYLIHVMTNAGLRMDFKSEALSEAMAQVRQWHEEQSK